MIYRGGCHCGRIAFEIDGEIDGALSCNCSICSRKGSLLWFVAREQLRLITPEEAASTYCFHNHVIRHRFCPNCGIHPYGESGSAPDKAIAAINLRCLEGIDLGSIELHHFDGRAA